MALGVLFGLVGSDVADDGRAGVGQAVVFRRSVEQVPDAGGGLEGHGVLGFFHVAAGDVQDAVCGTSCALERQRGVCCTGQAVGAGYLLQEVVGAHFADVVDQDDGHAEGVGQAFGAAHGGVIGVVGGQAGRVVPRTLANTSMTTMRAPTLRSSQRAMASSRPAAGSGRRWPA
jgi:hypothetical protein